jgi:DUF2975 family protein
MHPPPASGAVKAGHALVTGLLVLALAFGAVTIASVGVGLARHGDSLLYGNTLTVPLELSPDEFAPLPDPLELRGWPDVTAEVRDPTSKQMFLRSARDFGPLVLFVVGLWLLRAFLRSVMEGDPFGAPNVRRLRRIGFLLVLGAPAVELLNYSLRLSLFDDLPLDRVGGISEAGFSLPGGLMLGGLGAFILAEVFAYGVQLREDVEATV